jgi:hypothetical protein
MKVEDSLKALFHKVECSLVCVEVFLGYFGLKDWSVAVCGNVSL